MSNNRNNLTQGQIEKIINPLLLVEQGGLVTDLFNQSIFEIDDIENFYERTAPDDSYYLDHDTETVYPVREDGTVDWFNQTCSAQPEYNEHPTRIWKLETLLLENGKLPEFATLIDDIDDIEWDMGDAKEVYQWWVVADALLVRLEQRGAVLLKNDYGTWWGRETCGQAVYMDDIMVDIANEIWDDWELAKNPQYVAA